MPIRKLKGGGFKWGAHGHVYPTREGAMRQAQAAYANGYVGKSLAEIQKATLTPVQRRQRDDRRAVATGTGMTLAGGGLVGGGIPGAQANPASLAEFRASKLKGKAKPGIAAGKGGIFGYREKAHLKSMKEWVTERDAPWAQGPTTWEGHIGRGATKGKIQAEKKVLHQLKAGRKASNAALIGGLGLMAYGAQRKPKLLARHDTVPETHPVKKHMSLVELSKTVKVSSTNPRRDNQALVAGGTVGAVGSYGIARGLEHKGRQWAEQQRKEMREAKKISPEAGDFREVRRGRGKVRVPEIEPTRHLREITADPGRYVQGKTTQEMERLGHLRGQATQSKYFARVYRDNAKAFRKVGVPLAAGAAAYGGYNLARQKMREKGPVRKSLVMLSSEAGYGSVEKGRFRDARYARIAARRARRYAAAQAKGGTFVERNIAQPISREVGGTINESVDRAGRHFTRIADEAAENIKTTAQEAGNKAVKRVGIGVGLGVGGGIAGGTTLGAVGARLADPYGRHINEKRLKAQVRAEHKASMRKPKPGTPLSVVGKDMGDYPFLLPNIRQEIQYGIPETRMNPISPLQLVAGANIAAAGYTEVKRHWPIGKKKRRERGMLKLSIANLASGQPSGIGVGI